MSKVDARGLSCPAPVLETKAALENDLPQRIQVVVDNESAKQNVVRFLGSRGYRTEIEQAGDAFTIVGTGNPSSPATGAKAPAPAAVEAATRIMV